MRITEAKTKSYINALINAVVTLMSDNNVKSIDMGDTDFARGGIKRIETDGEFLYKVVQYDFEKKERRIKIIYGNDATEITLHRWDVVYLVNKALQKVEHICSYELSEEEEDDLMRDERKFED